ncbi:glycosyltransferase [Halomonas sabkhae]|uniref:glycosyltransferase n=1 Tax=Halomonas sabkhae TaxID=626223 RepID=UPI0025B3B87F|nr:glycosyltransferase [Halomonas sabkhae]MDN3524162.1 glycosyltransferase [Halomonas sabkhae]
MTLLLLVDNHPVDGPCRELVDNLHARLADLDEAQRADTRVLLVGFDQCALVAQRRALSAWISERRIQAISAEVTADFGAVGSTLEQLLVARWVDGQLPARVEYLSAESGPGRLASCLAGSGPAADATRPAESTSLPTLALVSPMPPQPTGIACYSAELLPYLAEHFRVSLIVDQPEVDPELRAAYDVLDAQAFSRSAGEFDHVLYQVGNSLYHAYQFPLMRRYPGAVVLHDFYLFDAVWWLQESGAWPEALRQQLYRDHGYPGVIELDKPDGSTTRGPESYPVNGFVTREAAGLIYHSEYARSLGDQWQPRQEDITRVIPHLRQLPEEVDQAGARGVLNVGPDELVIASFGGINPKKMTDTLVDAFLDSPLAQQEGIRLVLVGAQHGGEFGHQLARRLRRHPAGKRVQITGYVDRERYVQWLSAADMAVQLRCQSRGETSGAILDAMAHRVAVIANAHGSAAELPGEAVELLTEYPGREDVEHALRLLAESPQRRQQLVQQASDYVATELSPQRIAAQYRQALGEARQASRRHRHEAWLDRLAATPGVREALSGSSEQAQHLSRPLVTLDTTAHTPRPRILFDVSTIAWHDLKTGIERVTRRLADHVLRHPPQGWRVELIRWGGDDFYLARGFATEQLGLAMPPGPDVPVEARAGDIYVTVEWAPPLLEQAGHVMQRMRAEGVRFYFTVHDLLPLTLPSCFPADIPATMRNWVNRIDELADGVTCVSRQVADEVRQTLSGPWVAPFHLGADFSTPAREDRASLSSTEHQLLDSIAGLDGPTLLMVGTVEPRKGHRQVFAAMELLWQRGVAINLVIVGKQGWDVEDLTRRIKRHEQFERRVFWVAGASDAMLERLYADSDVLVAASLGEGFGLPLIEAAHHRIAILARDIPVFREVAGDFAEYFQARSPEELAGVLENWQQRWRGGDTIDSSGMPYLSWSQSAQQWMSRILADPALCHSGAVS